MILPSVVIVGAGFGGLRVARGLRRVNANVCLIDRFNHHLFQPLLYQVATASLSPADIAYPVRTIFRRQKNVEVLMAEVQGINKLSRTVVGPQRALRYDYLVVATGSVYNYFGNERWSTNAPCLKSLTDALDIRHKILRAFELAEMATDPLVRQQLLTFILVGGGPTGVEMAGALAELAHRSLVSDFRKIDPQSTRIILLEAGPSILSSFPANLSAKASRSLEKLGVEIRTDSKVSDVTGNGVTVSGEFIPSRNVIWTAGVKATPVVGWLGGKVDSVGRLEVNEDLSLPGHPEIFIIGDAALVRDEVGRPLPGLAPVAMQEGAYLGRLLAARISGSDAQPKPFRYKNMGNLATIGRSSAVVDFNCLRLSGLPAWLVWVAVHIVYLVGFRNRFRVLVEWAWSYVTFHRGARLITEAANDVLPPYSDTGPAFKS